MYSKLSSEFQNPKSEHRGKPFWSWNGRLEKEELMRLIHVMKEMGMGGYFCHSRTGLITEYLGDEWFDLINACADEGERLGLETWLYDEDRWPSGTAGGIVTENPEFRMKFIRLSIVKASDFVWNENVISAFTVKLQGFAFTDKKRIFDANIKEDETILIFTVEEMAKQSFYNGFTYVDTMNEKATEKYIEITHEKYREKCGNRLGKSIKGIFTDEPHRGAVMCGFGVQNENAQFLTPYTDTLFDEFQNAFGYDLRDFLPELYLWVNGEKIHQTKWQYMELTQRLFLKNFFAPINNWCKKNNVLLTGHVLHEDSLTAQGCMIGSVMRAYEYMDVPGVDVLGEHNKNFWIVKQIASTARQLGKSDILSELYGCTGWQMNFESHKAVGDWQALLGVNLRCHHLSWYTMEGEAKRDYPASVLHQSAWYKEYKYIEDYYSRIHLMMKQGEPVCDLLVLNPIESVWALIYPKWSWHLATLDSDVQALEEIYTKTFHILLGNKIDFDYGDEEMMSRLYKIETNENGVFLKIGKAMYKKVLICGMKTIRKSTLEILEQFIKAGGEVIIAGEAPHYVNAQKSDEINKLKANKIGFEENEIVREIGKNGLVKITDKNNEEIKDIFVQVRKTENETIILIMNLNREIGYEDIAISINKSGYLEKWDARTAQITTNGYFKEKAEFTTSIARNGELLFVLSDRDNNLESVKELNKKEIIQVTDSFSYRLSEPNVCVLDFARFKIENGDWQEKQEILKVDRKIREHFGLSFRGGEMIQPWYMGKQELKKLGKVKIKFEFFIKEMPKHLELAIETPEHFKISVNGYEIQMKNTEKWWIDKCFKVVAINKETLKDGKNEILLECDFSENINLEALYLLGDFAVTLSGIDKTIEKMPNKLKIGDIVHQGFPFYGAGISYEVKTVPLVNENEKLFIKLDKYEAACVKIKCENQEKIIAFAPFEEDVTEFAGKKIEIEYILTRRNTFGPLHQKPIISDGYGPNNYVTEGEHFLNDSYGLLPQGMTEKMTFVKFDDNAIFLKEYK